MGSIRLFCEVFVRCTHTRKHTQMRLLIFMFLVCVFLFFIWRCYTAHSTQSTHSLLLMLFFTSVIVFGILLLAAAAAVAIFSTLSVFLPTFISVLLILFSFSFFVSLVRFVFVIWWAHKPIHDMCKLCVVVFPLRASYYSSMMNTIVESEPPMVKLLNKLFYFTVGDFVACDFSLNCSQVIWYSL